MIITSIILQEGTPLYRSLFLRADIYERHSEHSFYRPLFFTPPPPSINVRLNMMVKQGVLVVLKK